MSHIHSREHCIWTAFLRVAVTISLHVDPAPIGQGLCLTAVAICRTLSVCEAIYLRKDRLCMHEFTGSCGLYFYLFFLKILFHILLKKFGFFVLNTSTNVDMSVFNNALSTPPNLLRLYANATTLLGYVESLSQA